MKKNIFYALSLICLGMIISSCADKEAAMADAHFYGTIEKPKADHIILSSGDFNQKTMLDSLNGFDITINRAASYYTLRHGRETTQVYLKPGDDLKVSLNARQFDESLKYEGEGAKENNYLASKFLKMETFAKNLREDYAADETTFLEKTKAYEGELNKMLADAELNSDFAKAESRNISYEYMKNKMRYESFHRYFSGNSDYEASESFKSEYNQIDFRNESDYRLLPSYQELVNNYFLDGEIEESVSRLKETSSTLIKDNIMKDLLKWLSPGTPDLKNVVADLKNMTTDSTLIAGLDNKFNEMQHLQRGIDSPGFNFADLEGNLVNLNDLKGKNVYIDVWATWCGPCKREIPHLKELETQYHDKNIEFVSISVDVPKDKQKWEDMVREKELKGIQLISDNGWNTDFVRQYLIKGIPRFILLDDSGKIVSADAPRPSSGKKIKGMIESLSI